MKVTRYINQQKWEGAIPPLLIGNKGILEVYRHSSRKLPTKTASTTGKEKKQV